MPDDTPISVVIGGKTLLCPPMPFYCLERAWPHIRTMSRLGAAAKALHTAELQVRSAITSKEHESATANYDTAFKIVDDLGADIVGQTGEALHILAAALSLDTNPPTQQDLAKALRPSEIGAVHLAVAELMDASGLVSKGETTTLGEALATKAGPTPNGALSSLN
jgi:hypothetical protein